MKLFTITAKKSLLYRRDVMHDIILIAIVGALNIVCFFTGVKAGRKDGFL